MSLEVIGESGDEETRYLIISLSEPDLHIWRFGRMEKHMIPAGESSALPAFLKQYHWSIDASADQAFWM